MSDELDRLKAAYAQEVARTAAPLRPGELPLSYEAITDEWLTSVLCRNHPGARVIAHRLDEPDEGNTSRRRIFLEYDDAGRRAGLPSTVFCKASFSLATRMSVGIGGGLHCETLFYNKLRPLLEINTPRAVWAQLNPETLNSIVILEDLGSATEFCTTSTQMTEAQLRGQMALLARLHARFYSGDGHNEALDGLPTWPDYFERLSLIGIEELCANGFNAAKQVIPPAVLERADEIWPATRKSVLRHRELPQMLIHSDVHLRNWYISPDGQMGLNDWQGACRGHWSRDVAYALTASMDVETRRSMVKPLLGYYLECLEAEGGPMVGLDEAWEHYRQQLFSALAWWTVTMPSAELPNMQPVDVTLEMIRRMTSAIDDYGALDCFG